LREHTAKLRDILARLDAAATVSDMDLPGFWLHALKGSFKGFWAVTVRANWGVIFASWKARSWTLTTSITTEGI
jgi:proteic killer suppression protein